MTGNTRTARMIVAVAAAIAVCGHAGASAQETIRLWPDGPPHSNGLSGPETGDRCLSNVSDPAIYVHRPDANASNRAAVLVIPGGGYSRVCVNPEGHAVAEWLTGLGFTAAVLKYRLPNGRYSVPFEDAQQALRLVRSRAQEWNLDPGKIGVLGFSAGGHLASTVGTHFAEDFSNGSGASLDVSNRPDFMILVYPVVTMTADYTHSGSRSNLLGDGPPRELVERFSNQNRVMKETPPTFIVHSSDDTAVPSFNSTMLYESLVENGVPVEMHIFEAGGHGYGLTPETTAGAWPSIAERWLQSLLSGTE